MGKRSHTEISQRESAHPGDSFAPTAHGQRSTASRSRTTWRFPCVGPGTLGVLGVGSRPLSGWGSRRRRGMSEVKGIAQRQPGVEHPGVEPGDGWRRRQGDMAGDPKCLQPLALPGRHADDPSHTGSRLRGWQGPLSQRGRFIGRIAATAPSLAAGGRTTTTRGLPGGKGFAAVRLSRSGQRNAQRSGSVAEQRQADDRGAANANSQMFCPTPWIHGEDRIPCDLQCQAG